MRQALVIGCYGLIYFAFDQWTLNTVSGRYVKDYLRNWNTTFWHGVMCAVSVWLIASCLILATGLAFR